MLESVDLDALAANARAAFAKDVVTADAQCVRIDFGEATVTFAGRADRPGGVACRAFVTTLEGFADPAQFIRDALDANFFWQGTGGATLSFQVETGSFYLTAWALAADVADPEALRRYVGHFLDTLVSWRLRARSQKGGVEALPDSARFDPPASDASDAGGLVTDLKAGMEVFQ